MPSKASAWLALTACVLVGQASFAQRPAPAGARNARADTAEVARRVVVATNEFRRQENLPSTGHAPQLASAARYFADFMARTGKYGHTADGTEPAARAKRFGYEYCIVAENIAQFHRADGIATAELADRLFNGWQNSPEHRRNILDPHVTETAVVVARSAKTDYYYAVQLFGRPVSQSIDFKVTNQAGVAVSYALDGQTLQLPARTTVTHRVCKPAAFEFRGKTLQPANGQQFVIVNDQNGVQLQAK
ncbi:MAG: CAP domain-containing protein [Burkholderiaceae bacterium]